MQFEPITFPKPATTPDNELAAHIGKELAQAIPGTQRHDMLTRMCSLLRPTARTIAKLAYDASLCAH